MTKRYYNTGFTPGKSTFVDIDSNVDVTAQLSFNNKETLVSTSVGATRMTSGQLTLVVPFKVPGLVPENDVVLNESMRINWNVRYGNAVNFGLLRTEVNRVLDEAIASYGSLKGLVPPAFATFPSE